MLKSLYHDALASAEILKGAADNETLKGAGVDMQGYEGVAFVAEIEAGEVLDFALSAEQDADSSFAGAAALEGSAVTISTTADAKGIAVLDIKHPTKRYVRASLLVPNAATAKAVSVVAIRYNSRWFPVGNAGKALVSPAEGVA